MKKILVILDEVKTAEVKEIIKTYLPDIYVFEHCKLKSERFNNDFEIIITDTDSFENEYFLIHSNTNLNANSCIYVLIFNPEHKTLNQPLLDDLPYEYIELSMNEIDIVSELKAINRCQKYASNLPINTKDSHSSMAYLSESFKDLYHSMTDMLFIVDSDGTILDVNTSTSEILWYSRDELLAMNFEELIKDSDDGSSNSDGYYWDNINTINEVKEYELLTKFGKLIPVEINTTLFSYQGKRALLKIAKDIVERKKMELENLSTVERFETFLRNSPDAFAIFDNNLHYVLCNKSEIDLLNPHTKFTNNEYKGHIFSDERLDYDLLESYREVLKTGIPFKVEKEYNHPYRGNVSVQIKAFRIGKELGLIAADNTDVANAKRKYEDFFNYSQDPLIIISPKKYKIIEANPSAHAVFNATDESEIVNKTLLEMTPKEQPSGENSEKLVKEMIAYTLKFGSIYFDLQMIKHGGKTFFATLMLSKVIHDDKVLLQATIRDVTAKRRIQDELKKLSTGIEQSPVSVLITDAKGIIEYVNPKFCSVSGYSAKDVVGKSPKVLQSGKTPREVYTDLWETIMSGKVWKGELLNIKKNGEEFWEDVVISPVKDDNNRIINFLAMKEDITKRKKYQSDKTLLEQQLNQALRLESIGTLAAGIAHEINTPIQFIGNNVGFVKKAMIKIFKLMDAYHQVVKENDDQDTCSEIISMYDRLDKKVKLSFMQEEVPQAINETLEGVDRVAKIVQAMKNFSYMGSEQQELEDINSAIESTIIISKNEWKYVADMETELDKDIPRVKCVIGDIKQVLLNLIVNASHAIKDKVDSNIYRSGLIVIKTYSDQDSVHIIIEDNGTGIPEQIQHRIYEPFFTTKEVGKGTGQGLSIAYQTIIEKHKGDISFESVSGEGTRFHIQLYIEGSENRLDHTVKLKEKLKGGDDA